jgi:hypothetical protein
MRAVLAAGALLVASAASAEPRVVSIEWQEFGKPAPTSPAAFQPVQKVTRAPSSAAKGMVRALVTLENPEKTPVEAIDVVFAVSAKLKKIGAESGGLWAVPFRVDERRVPILASGKKAVPLDTLKVEAYLREIFIEGYWPEALKIEVQLRPRKDMRLADAVSAELPFEWGATSARP